MLNERYDTIRRSCKNSTPLVVISERNTLNLLTLVIGRRPRITNTSRVRANYIRKWSSLSAIYQCNVS